MLSSHNFLTHQHHALTAPAAVNPAPRDREATAYSLADWAMPENLRID